jgi:uncharacterized protein YdhG (YjbR/CyaY superfamily)
VLYSFILSTKQAESMPAVKPKNIDEYISSFPINIQNSLQELRKSIQKTVPNATEAIKYGIPTFVMNGNLIHFAAYKTHIGFYPGSLGIVTFTEKLRPYKTSKGAIQFPLHQPLPLALITEIVQFRVQENLKKGKK